MTEKVKLTPAEKLAAMKAKQSRLAEAIAKQTKLEAERVKREHQQKLLKAGQAVEAAGLLDNLDSLMALLKQSHSGSTYTAPVSAEMEETESV